MPATVLDAKDSAINRTVWNPGSHEAYIVLGKVDNEQG